MPGQPMRLVIDLDRDAQGRWAGSAILPERGVKGAALDGLAVSGCDVDEVMQGREFVSLRASAADFRIEGRFAADTGVIDGAIRQGTFDALIVLRREAVGKEAS